MREMSASEPLVTHRNALDGIRTGVAPLLQEECGGNLPTGHTVPGVYRRHDSHSGSRTELENLSNDAKGKGTSSEPARPKVPMRRAGADCSVVARKRGNARGAKGAGHRRWERANWQQEEPSFLDGRRRSSFGGTSRMMREYHVRICERLGVKLPGPTRQRCGNAETRIRQARSREASASEPLQKCRKRIRRCQNRGVTLPPGSARGMP